MIKNAMNNKKETMNNRQDNTNSLLRNDNTAPETNTQQPNATASQPARAANTIKTDTLPERLSPHFSLQEMTRSGEAIRHHIENKPDAEAVKRLQLLCENVLEHLRRRVGRVLVTSGFRSKQLNKVVGGVPASQHCLGEAADLYVSSTEQAGKYADIIEANTDFDQLIMEPRGEKRKRWIHVSYTIRRRNRHQRLA